MPTINLIWGSLQIPAASTLNRAGQAADVRQITAAGAGSVVPLVYGEDWIGGLVLNVVATGSTVLVQLLWCLQCDQVAEVRFNGAALPAGASATHYTGGQTAPDATLAAALGAQGVAYGDTLTGYAYSVVSLPQAAFTGQLQFTARIRGRRLYDVRKDSTNGGSGAHRLNNPATWEWSDNPALALADALASSSYGLGLSAAWASVITTANACDATVGGERRRVVGVSFQTALAALDLVEALRAYAGAFLVWTAAGVKLVPDADAAAVATYDHSAGAIAAISALDKRDLGNVPTVVEVLYTETSRAPWREASALAALPGVGTTLPRRVSQVRLPGVQRYSQAYREAVERLNKLNLGDMSGTLDVFDIGIAHEIGDIVNVSHPIGLSAKPFRIVQPPELTEPGRWRLQLIEHDPAAYSDAVVSGPSVPDTVYRNPAGPPSSVSSITYSFEEYGTRLRWPAVPDIDVFEYELRVGASWAAGAPLDGALPTLVGGTTYLWRPRAAGTYTVWIRAVDNEGLQSPTATSVTVTVPVPTVTGLAVQLVANRVRLTWSSVASGFAITGYRVSWGAAAGDNPLGDFTLAAFEAGALWSGARTFWVQAIDAAGTVGTAQSATLNIETPGAVQAARTEIVDNNVLIFWSAPASGSLPIDRYEVRKGASWAAGAVVGSNGNSTFCSVFEQSSGAYTYWIAAVDSAGSVGVPAAVSATVSQPPDYILRDNFDSSFGGTLSNCALEGGKLYAPVFGSEDYGTHFTSRSWASPQDQVTAGYPLYIQPTQTAAYYEEDRNYGAVLPPTTITASITYTTVIGSVTVTPQIYYKKLVGDAWTAAPAGASSVLAGNFQYVRIRYDFAASGGDDLIEITRINLKLSVKLRTDSGAATITTASTGVAVNFGVPFVDADCPLVQPQGTAVRIPVVDFSDVPNPTGFTVYLYDTSGVKQTGSFSWTARGY